MYVLCRQQNGCINISKLEVNLIIYLPSQVVSARRQEVTLRSSGQAATC